MHFSVEGCSEKDRGSHRHILSRGLVRCLRWVGSSSFFSALLDFQVIGGLDLDQEKEVHVTLLIICLPCDSLVAFKR